MLSSLLGGFVATQGLASKIYQTMLDTYAECVTYSDSGTLTSGDESLSFTTYFHRPTKLYFEFKENTGKKERFVLWCPGSADPNSGAYLETHTWDTRDRRKESTELGSAIAGFTGISSGAACNITSMLLPGPIRMGNLSHFGVTTLEKAELIRGEMCDVVYSPQQDSRLWISQTRHVILRTWEKLGSSIEISNIVPTLNQDIPDSKFLFNPPVSTSSNISKR